MFTSTPTKFTQLEITVSSDSFEMLGIDVVLVEPDADILWLDLDQLGQRVLKPAADRDPASQGRVGVGKLFAAHLAGRVDAGAGLVDDDIGELGDQGVGRVRPGRCLRRGRALRRVSRLRRTRARRVGFSPAAAARRTQGRSRRKGVSPPGRPRAFRNRPWPPEPLRPAATETPRRLSSGVSAAEAIADRCGCGPMIADLGRGGRAARPRRVGR